MATVQKSIRIQKTTLNEIEALAAQNNKDFSVVANELLDEAVRMNRCPGIVFTEGVNGRRARIAGTGLEVWEVIAVYNSVDCDINRLRKAYGHLTDQQIMSAMGYYTRYTDEINDLIKLNEELTAETLKDKYPFITGTGR